MSTNTLWWLVGAMDGKKLGSGEFYLNFIPTGPVLKFCQVIGQGKQQKFSTILESN